MTLGLAAGIWSKQIFIFLRLLLNPEDAYFEVDCQEADDDDDDWEDFDFELELDVGPSIPGINA